MSTHNVYPPAWTVNTETGEVVGRALAIPDDIMAPPSHQVTIRLAGTVEAVPLNQPDPPAETQEG